MLLLTLLALALGDTFQAIQLTGCHTVSLQQLIPCKPNSSNNTSYSFVMKIHQNYCHIHTHLEIIVCTSNKLLMNFTVEWSRTIDGKLHSARSMMTEQSTNIVWWHVTKSTEHCPAICIDHTTKFCGS